MNDQVDVSQSPPENLPREPEHFDALCRMELLNKYYRWTYSLLEPLIGRRVFDAGCGIGNFTELLLDECEYVLAADSSETNLALVKERFNARANLEVLKLDLEAADWHRVRSRSLDTIVCLDVLEHVEDDVALLRRFGEISEPHARLLLKVPAHPWLYGSIDVASGHHRRYSRKALSAVVDRAGWQVAAMRRMNLFGIVPYWLRSRVLKSPANFSRTFSKRELAIINRVIPLLQRLDRWFGPPAGLSLILHARKL